MFEQIIGALVAAGIRFVVIGGVAAVIHGSARFTNDIDLCYDPDQDNLERLVKLLVSWHAYLREVEPGLPFILDVRAFRITPIMTLTTDMGDIDLLHAVPGVGSFKDVLRASEVVHVGKTEFRTLTLDALIASKKAVRRPKDVEGLIELEALRRLRGPGQKGPPIE